LGGQQNLAREFTCSEMCPCRALQSMRAPGSVPMLRMMLQRKMVSPHLVHVLSQSSGTVPMRRRGHWCLRSIFFRESAKKIRCQPNVGLKRRPKVVYRSLYSATVASQSLSNGVPYCYRPILNIGIDRTWAHHANFRLHTRDVAAARRGPPAFVTVVSTARAHSRRTTSSRPRKFAESRVQQEQTRKMVRL
jgi:hypothetical protein